MKRVLILAYDFPPYVSVGGLRPYSWYKYLNEFDVYPVVVTRQWNNKFGNHLDYIAKGTSNKAILEKTDFGEIIKAPYSPNLANRIMLKHGETRFKLIRKIVSAYYEFAQFILYIGPKASVYKTAKQYLKSHKVDVIIATGDPFILFRYASRLSKKYTIPWIADYRDPWSQNFNIQKRFLLEKWHSFFEKRIVKSASAITTVSDFLKVKISEVVKDKTYHILPNGYDPDALKNIATIPQQSETLNIAFVGSIYDWHPLRSFLRVFSKFVTLNKDVNIKLNFYGINLYGVSYQYGLDELVAKEFPELENYICIHKKIPNNELLAKLAEQNLLLLFNYYSYMGTKIFDYIALKRAILFCYSNDAEAKALKRKYYDIEEIDGISSRLQEELIEQTKSGYIIKDSEHLYKMLTNLYAEFKQKGYIQCHTINAENYSRKHQVQQLAEIIKNLPEQ